MSLSLSNEGLVLVDYPDLVQGQSARVPVLALLPNANGYQFVLDDSQELILADTRADIGSVLTALTGDLQSGVNAISASLAHPTTGIQSQVSGVLTAIADVESSVGTGATDTILAIQALPDAITPFITNVETITGSVVTSVIDVKFAVDNARDATLTVASSVAEEIAPYIEDVETAVAANGTTLSTISNQITTVDNSIATLLTPAGGPKVVNITLGSANTDTTFQFPIATRQFAIKVRDGSSAFRFAWVSGKAGAQSGNSTDGYDVVAAGQEYFETNIRFTSAKTIYLASSVASLVLTIRYWT